VILPEDHPNPPSQVVAANLPVMPATKRFNHVFAKTITRFSSKWAVSFMEKEIFKVSYEIFFDSSGKQPLLDILIGDLYFKRDHIIC
jgi:hypothetical protein